MILDLNINSSDDGYNAEIPSLPGCDCWAHTEDEVIQKSLELLRYYLKIPAENKIEIDKARRTGRITVYKLIFEKND